MDFIIKNITYNTDDKDLFLKLRKNNITPDTFKSIKSIDDNIKQKYKNYHLTHFKCKGCEDIVLEEDLINKNPYFCKKCKDLRDSFYSGIKRKSNPEKQKQTMLEKYGYTNYMQTKEFREKSKNKMLEKYGCSNFMQSKEFREKTKNKLLEKYGSEKYTQTEDFKEKSKQTKLTIYNDENYNNPEKRKQTLLERYGNESYAKSDFYKNYSNEKYGVDFITQKHIKNYDDYNEDFIRGNFIKDSKFLKNEFMDYFGVSPSTMLKTKEKYNILEPNKTEKHKTQNFIFDSINIKNKILNDRSLGFELDIYLPDYQLAVEYNGLMFHSQGISNCDMFNTPNFNPNYHLEKTILCNKNNIQLLHIFEGEDLDLWISMINNKLGLNKKIYARKCIIKELKYSDISNFLNENHLQRSCVSKINLGLYYNNKLVQVLTMSKPRFNKNYEYELIRLCSLKNTTVVGGASKLLSYFKRVYKPKNIISYANRRFSNGKIYEKLGFTLVNETNPNYFYFKDSNKLESRNKYQKYKLKNILDNFNESLTESQNMFNNGYRRIFDCGNLVYSLDF